jgi:hypothetical protein
MTQNPARAREIVQRGVATPHRPNMMNIINAGATQNERQSDIISRDPPRSFCFEYRRAIGPSMMSPSADRKIQSIDAQMYFDFNPSPNGLLMSSTARMRNMIEAVPNIAFVNVM